MPILEQVTMNDFDEQRQYCRTVICPFGSMEEHGSHLPLGTDKLHAEALAQMAATHHPVWVAPALPYGLCRSSSQHPGTIGIRAETLQAVVKDVVRSFYLQTMRNFILLSGHAGGTHMAALLDAGEQLLAELPGTNFAVLSVLDLGTEAWKDVQQTSGDSHAGEVETSLMLHLHESWVQGTAPEEYPSFPKHILVRNKRAFWSGGVWGNPQAASKEKGKIFLERSAQKLLDVIRKLESWTENS